MDFEKTIRDIQDTLTVMANLEARMSRALVDQAKWLENHEARLQESDARMTRVETKLEEVGDKLNALISFIQGQHGFPEAK
ncbi:MAG: hypothetical protein ACR2NN_10335 [Bryobacteraceae bacterium]